MVGKMGPGGAWLPKTPWWLEGFLSPWLPLRAPSERSCDPGTPVHSLRPSFRTREAQGPGSCCIPAGRERDEGVSHGYPEILPLLHLEGPCPFI